jgi:hypothetical protein
MPKCIEGQVEFKPVIPQVWLLLDRSGSMSSSLGTISRWTAMGNVLLGDPAVPDDRGVVGEFEHQVAFGVVFYTDGSGSTGCVLNLESVALAANNYRDIRQRYNKLGPSGGTPTADSSEHDGRDHRGRDRGRQGLHEGHPDLRDQHFDGDRRGPHAARRQHRRR